MARMPEHRPLQLLVTVELSGKRAAILRTVRAALRAMGITAKVEYCEVQT